MELTRRNFLKGLMSLAGVAVVGLPLPSGEDIVEEVEQFLTDNGDMRPVGRYGSVRIGEKWYALHGASIDMFADYAEIGLGTSWQSIPIMRSWRVAFELDTCDGIDLFSGKPVEIEFEMDRNTFCAMAIVEGNGGTIDVFGHASHDLFMYGVEPLVCGIGA